MSESFSGIFRQHMLLDPTFWGVVAGNALSIVLALTQGWDLGEIMWIYWAQSVLIGFANFYRMWTLQSFSTEGLTVNDQPVPETQAAKYKTALFFLVHYGFFHVVYAAFLWERLALTEIEAGQLLFLGLCAMGFAGSHGFSLVRNMQRDFKDAKPNLGTIMFYPYLRIIPMHLTVIFASAVGDGSALLFFMLLKTGADAGMHAVEHYLFQKAGAVR